MVQANNYTIENFDPEVLREYDIRGVVGENINENTAYTIGRTFGYTVKSKLPFFISLRPMHLLFSYGTLQQDKVQLDTFGRLLKGQKETLLGYTLGQVKITDEAVIKSSGKEYHPILISTGDVNDQVEGSAFLLTSEELKHADNYEVDDYRRVEATLASGKQCWIYAAAE